MNLFDTFSCIINKMLDEENCQKIGARNQELNKFTNHSYKLESFKTANYNYKLEFTITIRNYN